MLSGLLPASAIEPAYSAGGLRIAPWPTLLVVDSDTESTQQIVCFFEKRGFHVAAGASLAEAQQFFHRCKQWTLIVSDYHLPDGTGIELTDWLREQGCVTPVVLMTASPHCCSPSPEVTFLTKPFALETLESHVHRAQGRR